MNKHARGIPLRYFMLFAFFLALGGCVPSPTATPPRQTPFPTLLPVAETATPELVATEISGTPFPTARAVTPLPPTLPAFPTNPALLADNFAPIVQLSAQDPELPKSLEQETPLIVLAADDTIIARLELYDNNVLSAQTGVIAPSSVYSNQFLWKPNVLGKHVLRAIAYDAHGNASEPAEISINVINNNRAPEVMMTSPSGHKDAEIGAPLLIQGVATDDVAVTRMELLVDNQVVTFVVPERAGGITPFAAGILWTPTTTGTHNIALRAYDNQNQSDDSLRFSVRVFDNHPPVITAQSDRATFAPGDVLVVNALALSNNGVARVELYVDDRYADSANSSSPALQTALEAALSAPDLTDGAHSFFVRAYDVTGHTADTPRETIRVMEGAPRVLDETPTAQSTRTPLPPTPTGTPQINLPGPPTLDLQLLNGPVILPNAAKIQITARGQTELDHLEVWAHAPGETTPQLVLEENVKGATEKILTFDWNATRAGVVEIYARVTDNLKQERLSSSLRFSVQPPPAPTSLPAIFNFAQTWYAESPASRYEVTFRQIGRALRGMFVETRSDGKIFNGSVVSGAVNEKNVLFGVDLNSPSAGSNSAHTLAFDCSFNARPPVLTCNYTNENDERGSAIFQPLAP